MKKRNQAVIQIVLFAGILLFLNVLGNYFYTYLDMTEEKRYTLTAPTQELLQELDEVVFVKVLLEGDMPVHIKKLQSSVLDILKDFRGQSARIEFEFSNPLEGGTTDQIEKRQAELRKQGIVPVTYSTSNTEGASKLRFYPWAIFNYKGREASVNLIENQIGTQDQNIINNSIGLLEFKFANAIQKLQANSKPNVVFLEGHGELTREEVFNFERTLNQFYDTEHVNLDRLVSIPVDTIDAVIIAKPRAAFTEYDKFKIDQYVMNGGKVLWLIDPLIINIDSINRNGRYVPPTYDLNLNDLLFKYGIRLNTNMVMDLECSGIPLATGQIGNQPRFELFPFPYHPIAAPKSEHPIVKSLDRINLFFPASIDTAIRTKTAIDKTVLLSSSSKSRIQFTPATIDFEFLRKPPNLDNYNQPFQPMAVLYEGTFPSLYENRVTSRMEEGFKNYDIEIKKTSVPTSMIVVTDGDIIKNNIFKGKLMPLGVNQFDKYRYANSDFLLNAIEYLINQNGIIQARGKNVKLRLLDDDRARAERTKWQFINIGLPLVFLAIFGVLFNAVRRKRFAR